MFDCRGIEVRNRVGGGCCGENSYHEHTWDPNFRRLQNGQSKNHRRSMGGRDYKKLLGVHLRVRQD